MTYDTLWQFKTKNFRVALECAPEEAPDASWWDEETREKIESGVWGVYVFRVSVYGPGGCRLAADHLGDSVYADPAEFRDHRACGRENRRLAAEGNPARCGSYFTDMLSEAISEARKAWNAPRPLLRAA